MFNIVQPSVNFQNLIFPARQNCLMSLQVNNKTGRSKVGAISKAQKTQSTFFKKNLKFLIFLAENVALCRKCKRGDPLGFFNIDSVAKYQKTRKGDSFESLKVFRKKSHNAEKKSKGDPLVLSGFVGYVKKVKNERGTLLH